MSRYKLVFLALFHTGVLVFFFKNHSPKISAGAVYQPLEGVLFQGSQPPFEKTDPVSVVLISTNSEVRSQSKKINILRSIKIKSRSVRFNSKNNTAPTNSTSNSDSSGRNPFKYYEEIINSSAMSFPLNNRYKKNGLTLELQQICRWRDFYLLKYELRNEDASEFFISSAAVLADDRHIPSEFFMPFCCRPGTEVLGILKFPAGPTVERKVSFTLAESGNAYRKLTLKSIDYKF